MTQQEAIDQWVKSAQEDLDVVLTLFANKKFSHALFFCHLVLEKLLKAAMVKKTDDAPPAIHDLRKLAKQIGLPLSKEMEKELDEINSFNVEARYDIEKQKLYKKATSEYAKDYIERTKRIRTWILNEL